MKLLFAICILIPFSFIACRQAGDEPNTETTEPAEVQEALKVSIQTFEQDGGWGYDIIVNDEKYIHQPNIPAVNGLYTFKTEADAHKVAELVVQKIEGNIMPPTVSTDELELLQIVIE